MSITTPVPLASPRRERLGEMLLRAPRMLWIVLAIVVSWSAEYGVYRSFQPHGEAIRHELEAASRVLQAQLVPQPTPELRRAIRDHFRESDVDIDTTRHWPNVVVRLHGVLREDCLDALRAARRIDGPVVIALEGYGTGMECHERNDMTWWLMP